MFALLKKIQTATVSTRTRLNDQTIGSRIEQGKGQIVSVTYDSKGRSKIKELSSWVPVSDLAQTIEIYNA